MNHKRVERIWRQEGLKVPKKQPRRGRLWLNDDQARFILWRQGSMPLRGSILSYHPTRPPLRHPHGLADMLHCLPPSGRAQKFPEDVSFRIARSNA